MSEPKLIPPDPNQCQRMFQEGCWPTATQFMVIGPKELRQCTNKPVVICEENKPGEDGLKGSMSLCADCWKFFNTRFPVGFATFKPI